MENTIGKRIASLRKGKGLTQDELSEMMGISPQAISKWENDQSYPDITSLPQLAEILGITVDELLSGKKAEPTVKLVPEAQRKDIKDLMMRIIVDSSDGDKVRVNLPMQLVLYALEVGINLPQLTGNDALKSIDLAKILEMVSHGVVGNLVEVDSADGDKVRIFVE
jgi:transcriptional regulator with XRE-family HTH domain